MVSKASDDLPAPDRPVITVSVSRGMSTARFLRLCSRAPRTREWVSIRFRSASGGESAWPVVFQICSMVRRGRAAGQRGRCQMGAGGGKGKGADQVGALASGGPMALEGGPGRGFE